MKLEKIHKLLSKGDTEDIRHALADLEELSVSDRNAVPATIALLTPLINHQDLTVKEKALGLLMRISKTQPNAVSPSVRALNVNLELTLRRDPGHYNNLGIAIKSASIIKDVFTAFPQMVDATTINNALGLLREPVYNPGIARPGSDALTLETLSLIGTVAGLSPRALSNPATGQVLMKVYLDTFRYDRFRAVGGAKGSMRWWASYILVHLSNPYPALTIPLLVRGLSYKPPEISRGCADTLLLSVQSEQVFNLLVSYLVSPDKELSQYSQAAIAIIIRAAPVRFVPVLSSHFKPDMDPGMKSALLGIISTVGIAGGQPVLNTLPLLVQSLEDPSSGVRCASVAAISNLGASNPELIKNAIPYIISRLKDPDVVVRRCAVDAVGVISKVRPDLTKDAVPLLFDNLDDIERRLLVGDILLRFGINVSEYFATLQGLQSLWMQASELIRLGVDCRNVDSLLEEARGLVKTYHYANAMEIVRHAEQEIYNIRSSCKAALDVDMKFEGELYIGRWVFIDFTFRSIGNATARDVRVESPMLINTQDMFVIPKVEVGALSEMKIRWLPHISGRMPLSVYIRYHDPFGKEEITIKNLEIVVKEPAAPMSPYKAGGYAHALESHGGYKTPEPDGESYAQMEVPKPDIAEEEVAVKTFDERFEMPEKHTDLAYDPEKFKTELAQVKKTQTEFDLMSIIDTLTKLSTEKPTEVPAEEQGQSEEHKDPERFVRPAKVLMPANLLTQAKTDEEKTK